MFNWTVFSRLGHKVVPLQSWHWWHCQEYTGSEFCTSWSVCRPKLEMHGERKIVNRVEKL